MGRFKVIWLGLLCQFAYLLRADETDHPITRHELLHVKFGRFGNALENSILIECVVMLLLFGVITNQRQYSVRLNFEIFLVTIVGTMFTLPIIWFLFPVLKLPTLLYIILAEAFAITIEAWWYSLCLKIDQSDAFTLSFVANMASFVMGMIVSW